MGPVRASEMFLKRCPEAVRFVVTLYGSLAATGRGHMTDVGILRVLEPVGETQIIWRPEIELPFHPNGMKFEGYSREGHLLDTFIVYSIGGGTLANEEFNEQHIAEVYPENKIKDIMKVLAATGMTFWEYVEKYEDSDIWDFLAEVWDVMQAAIKDGLEEEGILPGGLGLRRKAATYLVKANGYGSASIRSRGLVYAYALAVSEHNAGGGRVVTAPTCGSCGIIPAVLYHLHTSRDFPTTRILRALATAGIFGNVVRTNASISGAEVGCQGEVGVACSMAAAGLTEIMGGTPDQVCIAAEIAMEHNLGLTCDPVGGQVQVPCIERNAIAAVKAINASRMALRLTTQPRVTLDKVIETMYETGKDMNAKYRETSTGGLAIKILPCD